MQWKKKSSDDVETLANMELQVATSRSGEVVVGRSGALDGGDEGDRMLRWVRSGVSAFRL